MARKIKVEGARAETPYEKALYAAGQKLLIESVEVGREFCKFMVGIAAGAIPAYLALVGLAVGKTYQPSVGDGIILLVAPGLFLVASGLFARGYFPIRTELRFEAPKEVANARAEIIGRRYRYATVGFAVFALATAWAIAGETYALSIEPSAKRSRGNGVVGGEVVLALPKSDREALEHLRASLGSGHNARDRNLSDLINGVLEGQRGALNALAELALGSSNPVERALGGVLDGFTRSGLHANLNLTVNIAHQQISIGDSFVGHTQDHSYNTRERRSEGPCGHHKVLGKHMSYARPRPKELPRTQ